MPLVRREALACASTASSLHSLHGDQKGRWAIDVSANLRVTFAFDGEHAIDVDLEGITPLPKEVFAA